MSQSVVMISKRRARESAEKATLRFKTENDLTKYMSESMINHPFLNSGFEFRIDRMQLENDIRGLVEKFRIHGYEDRGLRMDYLQNILRHKFTENPETFSIVMRFLLVMSESPTNVIHLLLQNDQYDTHSDSVTKLDTQEKDDQKDLDNLSDLLTEEKYHLDVRYSSDSDLSDWQLSESEDLSEKLQNLAHEKCNVRLSRSFSEFSQITERSQEDTRKEMELYWKNQNTDAKSYMNSQIRRVELTVLQSQPIISSLLTLQSKFGEYWEWKVSSHRQQLKQVILEEDIIREILWKISDPNPELSVIFTEDWKLRQELMISSLSQSVLKSVVQKYRILLKKLHHLHDFVKQVNTCTQNRDDPGVSAKPPKIYSAYAHCLSEIFIHITEAIGEIEKNLKKEFWKDGNAQPATTLIQMDQQLRSCFKIVNTIKRFHDQGVVNWREDANLNAPANWFCAIKLISCLEMYLNLQTQAKEYGIILYIYSKCIRAFFEDILISFDTLEWNINEFFLKRDSSINIRDSSFWTTSITVQPYEELLNKENITPFLCLEELMPKVATVLKTLDMLKQLGEDYKTVIGKISSSRIIVQDFIYKLLPNWNNKSAETNSSTVSDLGPDFKTHFRFLGLEGSLVADAFKFIVKPEKLTKNFADTDVYTLKDFVQISEIPISVPGETLNAVAINWIYPFYIKSQISIKSILKNYCVPQSLATFREIILEGREDFAKAVTLISMDDNKSEKFVYEDPLNRNPRFQLLLDECYPEGREHFQIDFYMDNSNRRQYKFNVTLNFPLNIILSPKSLGGYTYISLQLQKVRNSLWRMTALKMKDCKPTQNLELNRVLILRFSLIHYCSSILSFILFKLFNNSVDTIDLSQINTDEDDLDSILNVHETYLNELEIKLFRHPLFENIILKQMVSITQVMSECWAKGVSPKAVLLIEDTLKKCWAVIASDSRSNLVAPGGEFSDLASHVGPPPNYL